MPHHVVQRGNRRQQTFFCDADYRAYLSLLSEWCGRWRTRIWAYCLMPNHVHLVLVPEQAAGLARSIGEVHRRYTRRINFRENWRGYLWQGRFSSFVMDEPYVMATAGYVERNAVEAGLAERAEDWPWSSAAGHVGGRGDAVAEGAWLAERIAGWVCTWGEYLAARDEPALASRMRALESTGRPLGDEAFLLTVGGLLGRDLLPRRPGPRPRKSHAFSVAEGS